METPPPSPDAYFHVRVIIGIVVGLSISRLLTGVAHFVQHPGRHAIYAVHLAWTLFMLLTVVHFWWFEFRLSALSIWRFEIYLFVIFYAGLLFLLCTLLFPDDIDDHPGYREYFLSRRAWFFGLLALVFLVDLADTAIKGADHFRAFGIEYPIRNLGMAAVCVAAAVVARPGFHAAFVSVALGYQIVWILRLFDTL